MYYFSRELVVMNGIEFLGISLLCIQLQADWIAEQIQSYQAKKEDISDAFLVLQCDSEAEVKDLYKIKSPEKVLYCSCLLQAQDNKNYRKYFTVQNARRWLKEVKQNEALPWDDLSNEIYKNLSYYDKREALAQKIFYDRHDYYCEEDPQAPEQMEIDAPEFQSILTQIDRECDIKSIDSSEAFESACQSLSASISSESGDSFSDK